VDGLHSSQLCIEFSIAQTQLNPTSTVNRTVPSFDAVFAIFSVSAEGCGSVARASATVCDNAGFACSRYQDVQQNKIFRLVISKLHIRFFHRIIEVQHDEEAEEHIST